MSNPIALPEIFQAAFEDFIIPSYETAPFSTIQNRAKVVRSLKAIAGVERVHLRGLNLLQNEFGPSGERVFESSDKDSRIRMVGGWIQSSDAFSGYLTSSTNITDYVEFTFYGTGVNFLYPFNSVGNDIRASIDGGTEGSNIIVSQSSVLGGRNYATNTVIPLSNALTLGWHTLRLRNNSLTRSIYLYGFEVLNERTDLAVYSGTGVSNGSSQGLSALATSAFKAGVVGTRGARVIKYVQGGVISQAVQEVDATSKFLALTDHTNEEVLRRINFREFGADRADDFSTLALVASSRAFTLDDGTTTLVASSANSTTAGGYEYFAVTILNSFWVLTFVGTGLDLVESYATPTVALDSATFFVDGVSIGSVTSGVSGVRKICSGLPYGTHTVKMIRNVVSTTSLSTSDFIIYQPKKPSIPAGALKVADYNVQAPFAASASALKDTVSSGVLRKMALRENIYVGTWAATLDVFNFNTGFNLQTTTTASYFEYTFFGTGIEYRTYLNNSAVVNATFAINGSTNLSGQGLTATLVGTVTGLTLNSATGLLSGTVAAANNQNLVRITGLALGYHKIRVTSNNTASWYADALDIITPIHINDSTLKIGSQSLKSVTKYSPEKSVANAGPDLSKAKAWVKFNGVGSSIFGSTGVSAILRQSTGRYNVYFEKSFKNTNYVIFNSSSQAEQVVVQTYTNWVDIESRSSSGTPTDAAIVFVAVFGEQIDE